MRIRYLPWGIGAVWFFFLVACGPQPSALQVGLASERMPVPVGIGTVGYGGFGATDPSPFAELYPATERVHGHPDFRVMAVSRGEGFEIIFVRSDTVGVFQQLRQAVLDELQSRTGRDFDSVLVMGATHTHSGPGRVIDRGGPYDLIADRFFPEFYERMVRTIADTVEAAIDDLKPARLGIVEASIPMAHQDRRCEDGLDYTNDSAPVLLVERQGVVDGLMMSYAIHGTTLGIDALTLSQDVSGAIEHAVSQMFEHPVQVMMFNSWGADVSPANPDIVSGPGAVLPDGYLQMDRVGAEVAQEVLTALDEVQWLDAPDVWLRTHRVTIDRAALGYQGGEFPFNDGAVYCSVNEDLLDCDPETDLREEKLDELCLAFPQDYPAPKQTVFSSGRIGPFGLVTFPGEPGTLLAESVMDSIRERTDVDRVFFLGYAQDYIGYSILEEDWWQGGYEASGALWGPRQGSYLADQAAQLFELGWKNEETDIEQPEPVAPFEVGTYAPYTPTMAIGVGDVLEEVAETVSEDEVVSFTVGGSDPWLGTPTAVVLDEGGSPVLALNGVALNSDTRAWWVQVTPEPSYKESPNAEERRFAWRFHYPVQRAVGAIAPSLSGTYRIRVTLPTAGEEVVVDSRLFSVGPKP